MIGYLVSGESGEWENWNSWVVRVCKSEAAAKLLVDNCVKDLDRVGIPNSTSTGISRMIDDNLSQLKYDTKVIINGCVESGIEYFYEEVDIDMNDPE